MVYWIVFIWRHGLYCMCLLLTYFSSHYFKFKNKYCMGLLLIFPSQITLRMFFLCLFNSHIVRDFLGCLWFNKILFTNWWSPFCLPHNAEEEKKHDLLIKLDIGCKMNNNVNSSIDLLRQWYNQCEIYFVQMSFTEIITGDKGWYLNKLYSIIHPTLMSMKLPGNHVHLYLFVCLLDGV